MTMPRASEQGFTLLEMLVALSILALGALALVRLDAFTVRSTADLALNSLAAITAENVATQIGSAPTPPAVGENRATIENGGAAWDVVTRTTQIESGLLRIDIAVSGPSGSRAALTTMRATQ